MVTFHNPVDTVARQMIAWLQQGLIAGPAVRDYMAATLEDSSSEALCQLLQADADAYSGPLQELLFFPDEAFQANLEESLQKACLTKADEPALREALGQQEVIVPLHLPPFETVISRSLPPEVIPGLVTRLKIWKNLPTALLAVLGASMPPALALRCRVFFRNASFTWNEVLTRFFARLVQSLKPDDPDFIRTFRLTLTIIDEKPLTHDLQTLFLQKKASLLRMLHQYEIFETHRLKLNMEILMLQRAGAPAPDPALVRECIADIDAICLQVWGVMRQG